MTESSSGSRFLLEAAQTLGVGGELRGKDLDCHFAREPRIARAIDFAHTASANRAEKLVRTQRGARSSHSLPTFVCGMVLQDRSRTTACFGHARWMRRYFPDILVSVRDRLPRSEERRVGKECG